MMKEEPNSTSFQALTKAALDKAEPEDHVKKVFQRFINLTIGNHDLCKQECFQILHQLPFVDFGRRFVFVNIMGTRRVEENLSQEHDSEEDRNVKVAKNIADQYWARETDPRYLKAVEDFEKKSGSSGSLEKHPSQVSLYEYASKYRADWKLSGEVKVPHVTPNFASIPNKVGNQKRYIMFLKSVLLLHVPGTCLSDIDLFNIPDLEEECKLFVETPECPKLVREEFYQSQEEVGNKEELEQMDNPHGNEEDLLIEPDAEEELYDQDEPWERLLYPMHQGEEELLEEEEDDYDASEFKQLAQLHNWNEDAQKLNITTEDFQKLDKWLEDKKETTNIVRDLSSQGGLPSSLNKQQKAAFSIVRHHLLQCDEKGISCVPQLLLNIQGAPGTGEYN